MKEFGLVVAEAANDGREAMMSRVAAPAVQRPLQKGERRRAVAMGGHKKEPKGGLNLLKLFWP